MYQDRDRIARDLHDLVIQRLYATGMSLQGTMPMIARPEVADRVTSAVDDMDETIKEIRGAIFALQARDAASAPDPRADIVGLVEEMTPMLGFAPSLRLGAPGCAGWPARSWPSRRSPCCARRCPTWPGTPAPAGPT